MAKSSVIQAFLCSKSSCRWRLYIESRSHRTCLSLWGVLESVVLDLWCQAARWERSITEASPESCLNNRKSESGEDWVLVRRKQSNTWLKAEGGHWCLSQSLDEKVSLPFRGRRGSSRKFPKRKDLAGNISNREKFNNCVKSLDADLAKFLW